MDFFKTKRRNQGIMLKIQLIFFISIGCLSLSISAAKELASAVNSTVSLRCDAAVEQGVKDLWWRDKINNLAKEPFVVFNYSSGLINSNHPRASQFSADRSSSSLRISSIAYDDYGEYFCSRLSPEGNWVDLQSIKVSVLGGLSCSGATELTEGDIVQLMCHVKVATLDFKMVNFDWYKDGQVGGGTGKIPSLQSSNFGDIGHEVFRHLNITASWRDDQTTYSCRAEPLAACQKKLNVKYQVRDIELTSRNGTIELGEMLTCSAKGNPRPTVILTVDSTQYTNGSVRVVPEWMGRNLTVSCTASNELRGRQYNIDKSTRVAVVEATRKESVAAASSMTGLIIGIVIGLLILIILIIVVVVICRNRRKAAEHHPEGDKLVPSKDETNHDDSKEQAKKQSQQAQQTQQKQPLQVSQPQPIKTGTQVEETETNKTNETKETKETEENKDQDKKEKKEGSKEDLKKDELQYAELDFRPEQEPLIISGQGDDNKVIYSNIDNYKTRV